MSLTDYENSMMQSLYDYNRIPLWVLDNNLKILSCFFSDVPHNSKKILTEHIEKLSLSIKNYDLDVMYLGNDLYYNFSFKRDSSTFYLIGGPVLLSGFYHISELKSISFSQLLSSDNLKTLAENLPVVTLSSLSACMHIMMLLLNGRAPDVKELGIINFPGINGSLNNIFIKELYMNTEDYRVHTPYSHELAILNCVKDGDTKRIQATYKTLPQIKYGNMSSSHDPLKQLFYGSIANTTLVTRYAIEGGLEEETAFTLSDVYIQRMENCRSLYELNILNEKMAVDYTKRVSEVKNSGSSVYIKPIAKCIRYISKNINTRITLDILSKEVHLAPKYLSSLFRAETGTTLSSFIETSKVEKAKDLLAYSELSYSDISSYLCFNSQSYFISVFKKNTAMTPKEYRLKHYR